MTEYDDQRALHDGVTQVFAGLADTFRRDGAFSASLWDSLREGGFTTIMVPEDSGGSGGTLTDLATVLRVSGYHGAPVPVAEHNVAALLLAAAGREMVAGPLTIVGELGEHSTAVSPTATGWRVTGTLRAVPWATVARGVVVFAEGRGGPLLGLVSTAPDTGVTLRGEPTIAGEPSADVTLPADGIALAPVPVGRGVDPEALPRMLTLARALLMTGALRRVLSLTVRYSREREQFGKPIASFQAVAHQLASLAGAVELADASADAAVAAFLAGRNVPDAVLAARVCAGEAARVAIQVGHQVHGAIGLTEEHELHHHTLRLMAWRDQSGSESRAALELGRRISAAATGTLWELLTDSRRVQHE